MVTVVVAACGVVALRRNHTDAAASMKPGIGATVPSQFSTSGTPGWWQGATNKTSMALFQNTHDCFVSVQYYGGTVDAASELQKLSASQAGTGGSSTPSATLPMTLQTSSGQRQYDLHQYSLTSGDGEALMRGLELGYVQLAGGYVKVEGHCNTPDQLAATTSALQSVMFKEK